MTAFTSPSSWRWRAGSCAQEVLLWLFLIVFGVWPWVRPEQGVWVLQCGTWHAGSVHARVQACKTTLAADESNEPWTKLEKKYKEYINPVLILTLGLQTMLCCVDL